MKTRTALLMIAPAAFFFLFSFAIPLIMAGRLSFYTREAGQDVFVGFNNYARAFRDAGFLRSFVNVGWFLGLIAPLGIGIPYWLAMFLQRFNRRTQSMGRFVAYVPTFTAGIVIALLWRWLLQRTGLINSTLVHLGLEAVSWMGRPFPARVAIAMVSLSGGSGAFVILFSAVILSIPAELRDAARIDGATERQYRRLVVRPILMPTLLLALMLSIVGTLQIWEIQHVLFSSGGPRGSAATPVYDVFMTAFQYSRANYAAAKGLLLMVVIAAVVVVKQRIERWIGAGN